MFKKKKPERNEQVYNFISSAISAIDGGFDFRYAMGVIEGAFVSGGITAEEREELRKEASKALEYVKRANKTKRDIMAERLGYK